MTNRTFGERFRIVFVVVFATGVVLSILDGLQGLDSWWVVGPGGVLCFMCFLGETVKCVKEWQ